MARILTLDDVLDEKGVYLNDKRILEYDDLKYKFKSSIVMLGASQFFIDENLFSKMMDSKRNSGSFNISYFQQRRVKLVPLSGDLVGKNYLALTTKRLEDSRIITPNCDEKKTVIGLFTDVDLEVSYVSRNYSIGEKFDSSRLLGKSIKSFFPLFGSKKEDFYSI